MKNDSFVVYNLRETYHELGEYEFKIVLNPKFFKNGHDSTLLMIDSDGKKMRYSVETWGRKINCSFTIDDTVSDGVSIIDLIVKNSSGKEHKERLTYWIIKP